MGAAALHVCPRCGGDYVNPTHWTDLADSLWRVDLRCGACGHERDTVVGEEAARIFASARGEGVARIAESVDRLERERVLAGF